MPLLLLMLIALGCSNTAPTTMTTKSQSTIKDTKSVSIKDTKQTQLYKEVAWMDWGDVALLKAKLKHRPIAVYFYEDGCGYCELMNQTTFSDPKVIDLLNTHFVSVKARGLDHADVMEALFETSSAFPALAFLGPDGTLLVAVIGYVPPSNYKKALATLVEAMKEK